MIIFLFTNYHSKSKHLAIVGAFEFIITFSEYSNQSLKRIGNKMSLNFYCFPVAVRNFLFMNEIPQSNESFTKKKLADVERNYLKKLEEDNVVQTCNSLHEK